MYSTEQVRDILLGESLQDRFSRMLCTLNNELSESGPTLFYALLEYSIEEFLITENLLDISLCTRPFRCLFHSIALKTCLR